MDKFLDFITKYMLTARVQAYEFLFVGFGIVGAFFLINLVFNPYARHNKKAKRACRLLGQSMQNRRGAPVGKLRLPDDYYDGFQNYRSSQSRFPSEFITFKERKCRPVFRFLTLGCLLAICAAATANGVKLGFSELLIALLFGTAGAYVAARGVLELLFAMRTWRAKAIYRQFGRCLDMTFGERYFCGANAILSETCLDADVDDAVSKIEFLKLSGINAATAREIAALLSGERLNKPRTSEQQKKLNAALNGLLQALSLSAQRNEQVKMS